MTEKLYQTEQYKKECTAVVTAVDGNVVTLDRTIFAPEAGGQGSDTGTLQGIPVVHCSEKDGEVLHELAEPLKGVKPGDEVELALDWMVRLDHMQNHCGEHILSGILFTDHGIENKGFHLGSEISTLDAGIKDMPEEMVRELEWKANQVVFRGLPVRVEMLQNREDAEKYPLRKALKVDEDISVVIIDGVDCVACCCPHPADTSQVGLIKIIRTEHYKGMTRVYFKCGMRALKDYALKHDIVTQLNKKYSSEDETLLENMKIQEGKVNALRSELYTLKGRFAQIEAETLIAAADRAVAHEFDDRSLDELKFLGKRLTEKTEMPVILSSTACNTVLLTHSGKSGLKCGQVVKEFAVGFGGKGGGSDTLAQALFTDVEIMRNFVNIALHSV
ncbi:MAG: alanyl-tRNA editing protein [Firmicutes bacterium]|nr:alanyl-tRNA editing protein [Bacillota bacterium]